MPNAFDEQNPPFDRLTPQEIETLRRALDIGYFRPGETIIAQGAPAEALYVVIKGVVEEKAGRKSSPFWGQTILSTAAPLFRATAATTSSRAKKRCATCCQTRSARPHSAIRASPRSSSLKISAPSSTRWRARRTTAASAR